MLDESDGINYPFSINGKLAELTWKGKLLYNTIDWDIISPAVKWMLQNHKVQIDDVIIYPAVDTGMLVEIEQ